MSEHTPGPWRTEAVKTSIGHAHKIAPINACIYVDHRGTGERDTKTKEAAANARLIAAAPDLLETLEAVAPYFAGEHAYDHPHCVQLRAAIAKATNGGWLPPVPPHCLEEERDVSDPRLDVEIDYTNSRGERRWRRIRPLGLSFENNEWHPHSQWLLEAVDCEDGQTKTFSMETIHGWSPVEPANCK